MSSLEDYRVDTVEYKGYEIGIYVDDTPFNPREEYDNMGHMVCWHRDYILGDKQTEWYMESPDAFHGWLDGDEEDWDGDEEDWDCGHPARDDIAVMLPLYLMDHSGLWMNTGGFSGVDSHGWDWGQVGYIYVTNDEVIHEYGDLSKESIARAEKYLRGEVETYSDYISGQVYGYIITGPEGEDIGGCWGYFGSDRDYMIEEAKNTVDYDIEKQAELAAEIERIEREVAIAGALGASKSHLRNRYPGL